MTIGITETDEQRANIVVYDPDDAPAAAGVSALKSLSRAGAIDGNYNVFAPISAGRDTEVAQWLWNWIRDLPAGQKLQVVALASFDLDDEVVAELAGRVSELSSTFIEYAYHPLEHRYYFLNGGGFASEEFFVEPAVNLVIPAVDQVSDGMYSIPIAWDADDPSPFGWHIATETATLAGMWVVSPQVRLEPVRSGAGQPNVRFARSWARAVCVTEALPEDEDVSGSAEIAVASAFKRAIGNATPATAVAAAERMYQASEFDRTPELADPDVRTVNVSFLLALRRALAKLPAVFKASLSSLSSDLSGELLRGREGVASLKEFEAKRAEIERKLQDGRLVGSNSLNSLSMGDTEWGLIAEDILGVVDGGGRSAAAIARSALGSDQKVLTKLDRLTGEDVQLLADFHSVGAPDEESLNDLSERLDALASEARNSVSAEPTFKQPVPEEEVESPEESGAESEARAESEAQTESEVLTDGRYRIRASEADAEDLDSEGPEDADDSGDSVSVDDDSPDGDTPPGETSSEADDFEMEDSEADETEEAAPSADLPVPQSWALKGAYRPENYLAALSERFRKTLSEKRSSLATSREYLKWSVQPFQSAVGAVLTRSMRAVPVISLLIILFVILVRSHEPIGWFRFLREPGTDQTMFVIGGSIIAFWGVMLPLKPKGVGKPNYLFGLTVLGMMGFGTAFWFRETLTNTESDYLFSTTFAWISMLVVGLLWLITVFKLLAILSRRLSASSSPTDGTPLSGAETYSRPTTTAGRPVLTTPEQRVAGWSGGAYFYLLIVIGMHDWLWIHDDGPGAIVPRALNDSYQWGWGEVLVVALVPVGLVLLLLGMLTVAYRNVENELLQRRTAIDWLTNSVEQQEDSLRRFERIYALSHSSMGGWSYVLEFLSGEGGGAGYRLPSEVPKLGKLRLSETEEAHNTLRAGWISEKYKAALAQYLETDGEPGYQVSVERNFENPAQDFSKLLSEGVYNELLSENVVQHAVSLHPAETKLMEEIKPLPDEGAATIPAGAQAGNLPATAVWRSPEREARHFHTWHQSYRFDVSEVMRLDDLLDMQL